ncbi:hypothetical protein BAJUN_02050 [Bajunvirus bajun]|uniref:Uncharacterized protein n=1 Tax=Brevundimonas phage vB_BgoS-Bajun TaxID=2948594 RepID=A0A9E7N688_9CAUD|nr:hypothetical protein BAJUN_02050 [Brevundimonas phage vB_BgoS-Bajun]
MAIPEKYQDTALFLFHCALWLGGIFFGYLAAQVGS